MGDVKQLEYEVVLARHQHEYAIEKWCTEQFGARWSPVGNRHGRWTVFWAGTERPKEYRWCFATEQDAVWFALRWA